MLVPIDKSKDTLKIMKKCETKLDLLLGQIFNSDIYDEKEMKIKFNSDHDLPLKKVLKLRMMEIVVRPVFHESIKYYAQVFLHECLNKL